METEKNKVGTCPICGGDVVKTVKGWACINTLETEPKCNFFLFSTISNRRISDTEASLFLKAKKILLDGFVSREGKNYTSILTLNQDGSTTISSQIGKCPKCGGTLYIGAKAVSCGNFKDPAHPCNFTLWRNIGGHDLSLSEIEEILSLGATLSELTLYDAYGNKSEHKIGLNAEKDVVRL